MGKSRKFAYGGSTNSPNSGNRRRDESSRHRQNSMNRSRRQMAQSQNRRQRRANLASVTRSPRMTTSMYQEGGMTMNNPIRRSAYTSNMNQRTNGGMRQQTYQQGNSGTMDIRENLTATAGMYVNSRT